MTRSIGAESKFSVSYSFNRMLLGLIPSCIIYFPLLVDNNLRDTIPEPFDVFNHAGNTGISTNLGAGAGAIAGALLADGYINKAQNMSKRRLRASMAGAGLAVGVLANALVETRLGISVSHWSNTTDPLDFIYGTGAAVISAATLPIIKEKAPPHS